MYEIADVDEIMINDLLTNYGSKLMIFDSLQNMHNSGGFQSDCFISIYGILQSLDKSCIRFCYNDLNLTDTKRSTIIRYLRNMLFIFEQLPNSTVQALAVKAVINKLTFDINTSKYNQKYHYSDVISSMTAPNKLTAVELYKKGMIKEFYNYLFLNESIQNLLAFKNLEYLDTSILLFGRYDIIILEELDWFIDSILENNHSEFSSNDKKFILMQILNYLKSFNFKTDEMAEYLVGLDLENISSKGFISNIGVASEYARSHIKSLIL